VLVAGVLASVRHLKQSSVEREGQQAAAAYLKRILPEAGLPVMNSTTHIVPLMVGDPVEGQDDQRHPARRIWRLCAADQLPHRPARHRTPALHPRPAAAPKT
jgi:7-keto-8-aminopelargonate synthetase-like enzyme